MTLFVQVLDGEVKQVWDTPPSEGVGNNGWRNAVEVRPAIQAGRQGYTDHRFDLTTDPVQIIWDAFEFPLEDRKFGLVRHASIEFRSFVEQQSRNPETFDVSAVEAARQAMLAKQAAIEACTTHDELDAL